MVKLTAYQSQSSINEPKWAWVPTLFQQAKGNYYLVYEWRSGVVNDGFVGY